MFSISNDELKELPPIKSKARCGDCGEMHEVKNSKKVLEDGTKVESDLLTYIVCPKSGKSYLVGIEGKKLDFNK